MPQLVIDNWLSGVSYSDRLGKQGSYYVGTAVNPVNSLYPGYLQPGGASSNISNSVSQANAIEIDGGNSNAYLVEGDRNKVHKLNLVTEVLGSTGDWPIQITQTGSTPICEDVKIYPVGSTYYFFVSYNRSSADGRGDIGRGALGTGAVSFDPDFMSTTPSGAAFLTTAYPHPMMEWKENGFLYIADGRNLHQFDGQTGGNGTLTTNKFQLPVGWVITSLFDAGDLIGMTAMYYPKSGWSFASYGKGKVAVFFWDGTSSTFNKKVPIEDMTIRASKSINGNYYIFGQTFNSEGVIRKWDGTRFVLYAMIRTNVERQSGDGVLTRYPKGFGGVTNWKDAIMISAYLGYEIFFFGQIEKDLPEALFVISTITQSTSDNIECFAISGYSSNILVSARKVDTDTDYLIKISMNDNSNANFLSKSLWYEFPKRVKLNYVKCYFKALASGQGDDVTIDYDYGAGSKHIGNISFAGDGATTQKRLSCKDISCNNLRVVIDADEGAGIKYGKIVVDYDFLDGEPK